MFVVRAGPVFEILATNDMGAPVLATPTIVISRETAARTASTKSAGVQGAVVAMHLRASSRRKESEAEVAPEVETARVEATGVTASMRVWREEVFGPVLAVMRFKTEAEAGLNGRALAYPRGKVIGGSSAINATSAGYELLIEDESRLAGVPDAAKRRSGIQEWQRRAVVVALDSGSRLRRVCTACTTAWMHPSSIRACA